MALQRVGFGKKLFSLLPEKVDPGTLVVSLMQGKRGHGLSSRNTPSGSPRR